MKKFEIAEVQLSDEQLSQMIEDTLKLPPSVRPHGANAREKIKQLILEESKKGLFYINDRYQVKVKDVGNELLWLSIKRLDKEPIHDWRDLQEIKNQIVGKECEGVEIYPAESRKVDGANQYHLWVYKDPKIRIPFGMQERLVDYTTVIGGSKQRPEEVHDKEHGLQCDCCGKKAEFVRSRCCGAHFEGRVRDDGTLYIVCEKCGKYVAEIKEPTNT